MFRGNTAWRAEERKEVTQHLGGSPGDKECRVSHTRSLGLFSPHIYVYMYVCMYIIFFSEV